MEDSSAPKEKTEAKPQSFQSYSGFSLRKSLFHSSRDFLDDDNMSVISESGFSDGSHQTDSSLIASKPTSSAALKKNFSVADMDNYQKTHQNLPSSMLWSWLSSQMYQLPVVKENQNISDATDSASSNSLKNNLTVINCAPKKKMSWRDINVCSPTGF